MVAFAGIVMCTAYIVSNYFDGVIYYHSEFYEDTNGKISTDSMTPPVTEAPETEHVHNFVEETVPATTEAISEETISDENVETTAATEKSEDTETTETSDTTQATEAIATAVNSNLKDVQLKLKMSDIQLGVYYQFQLELDCALSAEEVTWSSEHPHIAKVDEKGNVTAVKDGTTSITAKYGDQEVQCIVRCIWY